MKTIISLRLGLQTTNFIQTRRRKEKSKGISLTKRNKRS